MNFPDHNLEIERARCNIFIKDLLFQCARDKGMIFVEDVVKALREAGFETFQGATFRHVKNVIRSVGMYPATCNHTDGSRSSRFRWRLSPYIIFATLFYGLKVAEGRMFVEDVAAMFDVPYNVAFALIHKMGDNVQIVSRLLMVSHKTIVCFRYCVTPEIQEEERALKSTLGM